MNEEDLICPRCGTTSFNERDCGPDSYDDDISYTSYVCTGCELWYDGWANKWYEVDNWRSTEDADEWKYITKKEIAEKMRYISDMIDEHEVGTGVELNDLASTIAESYVSEHETKRF